MYYISKEESEEIRKKIREVKNVNAYRRLEAVALRGEGKTNEEIASITGFNPDYAGQIAKRYCINGISSILEDGRKGGNNRNMSEEEGNEFLRKYEEEAKNGKIIGIGEISKAYDEAVGKTHESKSTIYYFLHRHGWRIVTPQKQHPGRASDEEIEASKKLTKSTRK